MLYDDEGEPFTVKYHLLSTMLLNELQKQETDLGDLRAEVRELRTLEVRLEALEALEAVAASVPVVAQPYDSR